MNLTKEQVNTILKNAPVGADKKTILDGLIMRGYNLEGVDSVAVRQVLQKQAQVETPQEKPNYIQRVGEQYTQSGKDIVSGIQSGASQIEKGIQQGGIKSLSGTANILGGEVRSGLRTVGGVAKAAFAPIIEAPGIKQTLEFIGSKIAGIPEVQQIATKANELSKQYPEYAKDIKNVVDIATLYGGKAIEKPIQKATTKVGQEVGKTIEGITTATGKVISKPADYTISRLPKLLGIFSGETDETIKYALKDVKAATLGLQQGDVALRNAVKEGATNSIQLRNAFSSAYNVSKQKILGQYTKTLIPRNNVKGIFNNLLKENNVQILKDGTLDFTKSKIVANPGEIGKIEKAYTALNQWDKFNLSSLDDYKQIVGKLTRFPNEAGGSSKSPFLGKLYYELNNIANTKLPKDIAKQYAEANKKFSEGIDLYDDMVDAFNSGDPFVKLANALGDKKDTLRQVLDFYEKQSGKSVLPIVAGRSLAAEKQAAFGFLNPRSWIDFFISPEKQGEIILKVGEKLPKR